MEPNRTRLLEIATTAISYMADNNILEDYLEDRYIDFTQEERKYFCVEEDEELEGEEDW